MDTDEILSQVPIADIATKLGVSEDVARQAVQEGGAALLGGLAKNAESPAGSAAIEQALAKHDGFTGAASLDDVDEADGEKIVSHVFGDDKHQVAEALTKEPRTAGIDFGKLLPILAPIVMGIIANSQKGKSAGGGGLGDILGGLLGGGNQGSAPSGGSASSGGSGGLGDILGGLGGLFGGGSGSSSGAQGAGNVIGDILGGLLGGRK